MRLIVKNKKSSYEYEFILILNAGIKLNGSEVKSIRKGKVSINDSYCYIKDGEIFIKGMHISEYENGSKYDQYDPNRVRKLLLKKSEIIKLKENVDKKGLTIIPISVNINNYGLVKVDVALCRGKKIHDKKQKLKELSIDLTEKRESLYKI